MQRCIPLYRSFASHVATSCGSYGRKTCFSTLQSIRPVAINNRSSSNWLCCPPSNVEIAIFRRCLATEPALKSFGPRNAENDKIEAPSPVKAAAVTTPVQQPHEFDDDNSIEMSLSSSGSTPPATNPNRTKGSRKSKLINRRV